MLKGILIVILVLVVAIGYMWYDDILPFNSLTNSIGFSPPSVEKIQQFSNVITSSENKIVYYSFEDVPSLPDKQIPINALKKAIQTWEAINPNLEFIQSENSNIEIRCALDLAQENALLCGLQNRVEFRLSDWFESLKEAETFDLIVSNPPYLTRDELDEAESEVKDFEPKSALVADDAGKTDLLAIISGAHPLLKEGGTLWLETGIAQRDALLDACRENGYSKREGLDDWSSRPRFIRADK